jgi:hypothetical protein
MEKKRIFPLMKIMGIQPKMIKPFSKLGIDSAEELVGLSFTPLGLKGMAKHLDLDEKEVKKLVENAKQNLPKELLKKISKPSTLEVGFGARIPKRRKAFEVKMAQHPEQRPTRPASQFVSMTAGAPPVTAVPDVNLIDKLTDIRNQGMRGTCVAFSSVAVREFLTGSKTDLSEQFLYWWCDAHDDVPEEPGTTVEMGFNGLLNAGVCLEGTWPYNPYPISGNEGQGPPPTGASDEASQYKILQLIDLDENSIDELKSCLKGTDSFPGRPIAFSIPVYNSWFKSMAVTLSGQITMPLPGEEIVGGHAMVLVGYQDDASVPGGGFFIIRNSWGKDWGENCEYGSGYGTIPYKYISQYCWEAFTGDSESSPAPPVPGKICFIATAAYGSPYAKEVQFLRNFRDVKLKTTPGGKAFVDYYENIYYKFSPYIAQKMNENVAVKNIMRWFIVAPIVYFLQKAVGFIERKRDKN